MHRRAGASTPEPHERHAALLSEVRRAVLEGEGVSNPATRAAAAGGVELTDQLDTYLSVVRDESYRVTDGHITALKATGHSEQEIFELTVAAALGRALRGLDAGLRAMTPEASR